MLVTVDIGNTNIGIGVFKAERLVAEFRLATYHQATADDLHVALVGLMRNLMQEGVWQGAVISSVVPELNGAMETALRTTLHAPVLCVNPDMTLPVKNEYDPPSAVGADRLMNAVAAVHEFGAPVIIVDVGTAITVDAVSARKAYLGGAILPGPRLAGDALARGTSLLPRIALHAPRSVIGRDTENSLCSGIVLGSAGAVVSLVRAMQPRVGKNVHVVITGGLASLLDSYIPRHWVLRPYLTLDGMRLTWEDHLTRRHRR